MWSTESHDGGALTCDLCVGGMRAGAGGSRLRTTHFFLLSFLSFVFFKFNLSDIVKSLHYSIPVSDMFIFISSKHSATFFLFICFFQCFSFFYKQKFVYQLATTFSGMLNLLLHCSRSPLLDAYFGEYSDSSDSSFLMLLSSILTSSSMSYIFDDLRSSRAPPLLIRSWEKSTEFDSSLCTSWLLECLLLLSLLLLDCDSQWLLKPSPEFEPPSMSRILCVSECCFIFPFVLKPRSQIEHLYGLSLVCER